LKSLLAQQSVRKVVEGRKTRGNRRKLKPPQPRHTKLIRGANPFKFQKPVKPH
jgi:hypothetical protein